MADIAKKIEIKNAVADLDMDLGAEAQNVDVSSKNDKEIIEFIDYYCRNDDDNIYEDEACTQPAAGLAGEIYRVTNVDTDVANYYRYDGNDFVSETIYQDKLTTVLENTRKDINSRNILGAKNFIPLVQPEDSINGITYTIAEDGHLILNGYATADSVYNSPLLHTFNEEGIFTIDCASLPSLGVHIELYNSLGQKVAGFGSDDVLDGMREITVPAQSDVTTFRISINNATTLNNLAIYPMLRLSIVQDRTFARNAMTNYELTDRINNLHSTFAELDDVDINESTLENGQISVYNSETGKWENGTKMNIDGSNASNHVIFDSAFTVGSRVANTVIGQNSASIGNNNIASGDYSKAYGINAKAIAEGSVAEGEGSTAGIVDYNYQQNLIISNFAQMPERFRYGRAVIYNNEIHTFDGSYHYKLDMNTKNWVSVSTLPYDFDRGSVVVYNNKIHILGGVNSTTSHYSWNNGDTSWTQEDDLPREYWGGAAIVYNNKIYLLGGDTTVGSNSDCDIFEDGYWTSGYSIPFHFHEGSAVVYNNEIHLIGTGTYHYKGDGLTSWTEVDSLPFSVQNEGLATVYNNEIHIFSDFSEIHYKWSNTGSGTTMPWIQDVSLPTGKYPNAVITYNNKIYALGTGEAFNPHYNDTFYIWNGVEWNNIVGDFPYPFEGGAAVVYNGELHIMGSSNSEYWTKHYKLRNNEWVSAEPIPNMPIEDAIVCNNELYITLNSNSFYKWQNNNWVLLSNEYWSNLFVYNNEIYGNSSDRLYKWNGNQWESVFNLKTEIIRGFSYNNKIYIIVDGTEYHFWNGEEWEFEGYMPYSFNNYGSRLIIYNNEIHIFNDASKHYKLMDGGIWKQLDETSYYIPYSSIVVYNNEIHILGGTNQYSLYRYIFKYTTSFVSGKYSHAEGYQSVTKEDYSHAEGYKGITDNSIIQTKGSHLYALGGNRKLEVDNTYTDNSPNNVFSIDSQGNYFSAGAQSLACGELDGVLVADGPRIILEDGASYMLYVNGRFKANGAWRGAQVYYINAAWSPNDVAVTSSASALPQIATLGTVGTACANIGKYASEYAKDMGGNVSLQAYHSSIGIGSCTTGIVTRWNLVKVLGSVNDF